jgi:hypothetical protein
MKRVAINGEESDVFSRRWRRMLTCTQRPGYCKKVKRRANRRERREGKQEARAEA